MFGKFKIKRLVLVFGFIVLLLVYILFNPFNEDHIDFVKGGFIHKNFNKLSDTIANWLEGQVLGISYKERFCKHMGKWTKESKYPPVNVVAKQLSIKDGDTIFVNGLHCGEWLVALKGTFPNIKLYGVDKDSDSIEYVQQIINGTFKVSEPFELDKVGFQEKFDHAIIDGILSIYSQDLQCKALIQIIPMLKAGGSLYIGKNFEQCDENKDVEKKLKKYVHVQVLPKCFWSNVCLQKRHDIAEILYSKENHIMKESSNSENMKANELDKQKKELLDEFSSCATSVFIHKHIVFHSNQEVRNSQNLFPDSKYEHDLHLHKCTRSDVANSTSQQRMKFNKEKIKQAVIDLHMNGMNHVP